MPTKPPLSLPDYERIFRVIHGVLLNEKGDPSRACLYFGGFGAAILNKHHGLHASAIVGAAAYNLTASGEQVLAFALPEPLLGFHSAATAFHCWVEIDGWVVDFFAPLLGQQVLAGGLRAAWPPKMFQKTIKDMAPGLRAVNIAGNYWFEPNDILRSELFANLGKKQANRDLLEICIDWYRPSPQPIRQSIVIGDQHGRARAVPLSPVMLEGAW